MTRTLTLKSNQPSTCEATKTLTKKCKKATKAGKANPKCKYSKKADWSSCVNGEMTRTLKLKGGKAVSGCEATKVDKKPCK